MEADPRTVNFGLAGGKLDATKHIERAMHPAPAEPSAADIDRMLQEAEAWANGAREG